MAKTLWNFGYSECNRVQVLYYMDNNLPQGTDIGTPLEKSSVVENYETGYMIKRPNVALISTCAAGTMFTENDSSKSEKPAYFSICSVHVFRATNTYTGFKLVI